MSDHARFESTYAEYNRVLRTWFVAFGAGTPGVLLLSNESRILLKQANISSCVIWALAIGVVLQIFIAGLNKYIAWCNAFIESYDEDKTIMAKKHPIIYFVAYLTDHIWIDLLIDIITALLFGYAIINLFGALI